MRNQLLNSLTIKIRLKPKVTMNRIYKQLPINLKELKKEGYSTNYKSQEFKHGWTHMIWVNYRMKSSVMKIKNQLN